MKKKKNRLGFWIFLSILAIGMVYLASIGEEDISTFLGFIVFILAMYRIA